MIARKLLVIPGEAADSRIRVSRLALVRGHRIVQESLHSRCQQGNLARFPTPIYNQRLWGKNLYRIENPYSFPPGSFVGPS